MIVANLCNSREQSVILGFVRIWTSVGEKTLWDALPSFQREALEMLCAAFPGSEWVELPEDAQERSEAIQAVA